MAETTERSRTVDALQTVVALIGITLGVVPSIRWSIAGEHGSLFGWIFGDPSGAMGYLMPFSVIGAGIFIILVLEGMKERT